MGIETLFLEYVLIKGGETASVTDGSCLSQRHFRLGAIGADNKIGRTYDRRTEER